MKINIVLPFVPKIPNGGLRVMFEYAKQLHELGHNVIIYYTVNSSYIKQPVLRRIVKYLKFKYFTGQVPMWFPLPKEVNTNVIYSINDITISDADVIFSTWWSLCFDINKLTPNKGKHFNLIQDIENWNGNDDQVLNSYEITKYRNVVIAKYLFDYIYKVTGQQPHKVSFAIDSSRYKVITSIVQRDKLSICMLYSKEPRKGTEFGLEALNILRESNPNLKAKLFGICQRPQDLPEWIEYYENYNNIPSLYDQCSIFIGPSNQEGCALPPMEAMYSGCAVVCTNIDGHKDYAFDKETVLLAEKGDASDIAVKVQALLNDDNLRQKIAQQGNSFVNQFSWKSSAVELEKIFMNNL